MKSRPADQSDAERAVNAFKHTLLIKVERAILELALRPGQPYVYPGDISADIVAEEHRQGVVSNAWGALRALEIIEPLPVRHFDDAAGIIAGKKANPNPGAKGRMVMVYRLAHRHLAETWLDKNCPNWRTSPPKTPATATQLNLLAA